MTLAVLLWGLVFSAIGLAFFIYGKKNQAPVPLVCGVVLMIYPFFISNLVALVVIGAALTAVPYFLRL